MRRFLHWFSHGLIRYRYGFLAICLIISLFFTYQLKNLSFNTNLGDFYSLKHPYLNVQKRLNDVFGGLNQVSIAIETKDGTILNPVTLEKVWQITNQLYLTEGINAGRVVSLSARKVKHVEVNEEGFKTEWLMHDPPKTPQELEALKQRIIINPLVYGPIVSKDFKATLTQADFESNVSSRKIFDVLQGIKNQFEDANNVIYISGQPVLQGWLDFYLPRMSGLFIITLVAMSWVLYNAFKSKRGVFLPLLSAFMATLWGLGMTVMLGYKLTPATVLAPFLVFALGVSHSVQFIKHYYEYMSTFKRWRMYGCSFNKTFTNPSPMQGITLRGDLAYYNDEPTYYGDPVAGSTKGFKRWDNVFWLIGMDKYVVTNWLASFQFSQYILEHSRVDKDWRPAQHQYPMNAYTYGPADQVENIFTLKLSTDFMHERLKPEISWSLTDDPQGKLSPKVTYEIKDNLWLTLGIHYFYGNEWDSNGQYRDQNQFYTHLKYTF